MTTYKIKYIFSALLIAVSFLLPRESQSQPVKLGDDITVTNVLVDTNLWHKKNSGEKFSTHKKRFYKNIVDYSSKNSFFIKDEKFNKNFLDNSYYFYKNKTVDQTYSSQDGYLCILCTDAKSSDFRSFSQPGFSISQELKMSDEYSIFEMINSVYPVSFMGEDRLEIGLFETLAMIGFGFLMGILKYLRLNHFAMLEVHHRNGEIVGAPMERGLGNTGRPRKAARRTPLFVPRMPVPGL